MKVTGRIAAPHRTVFALFTDLDHAADRIEAITRIEMLTPGPMREGTVWRETRTMFKKECTEQMQVTHFAAPDSYTVHGESCGMAWNWTFRFRPDGPDATTVELEMNATAVTRMSKIMAPLTGLLMKPMMRKCIEKDFDDLRKVAESGGAPVMA